MPHDEHVPTEPGRGDDDETLASTPSDGEESQLIGPYRLRRLLGEGGMGEVWLAEQTEPIRRLVALKIIKQGMDSRQVVARFEAERQALAMMNHPNVARVYDAGMTPRGRPYFAMEYIQGTPITSHCDRHKLTTSERLELFRQVCEGVQHAHQKAIIHRDLKPSNVLVAEVDGRRIVKIIDFGVAKALAQPLTDTTLYTQLGAVIGTPEYMSPEQADLSGEDIDTRTDVYALGVILYELLVGALPFDPAELRRAGYEGIRRMIREQDPPRPSTRLSTLGDRSTVCAAERRADVPTLRRLLSGDLDWITLKALEKDRARRYASPLNLAEDIDRYLADEPVEATPPSRRYKLRKFARRNRALISSLAAVAAALVLGIALSTWGLVRAQRAEQVAAAEAAEARRQAEIAGAVNDFLNEDLLSAVSPSSRQGRGIDTTMREVLDVAAARIEEASRPGGRFVDKPLVEAAIRQTLGQTYENLGEHALALPHYERELELRLRVQGERSERTNWAIHDLGFIHYRLGNYDRAEELIRRALRFEEHAAADERRGLWEWTTSLAIIYEDRARYDEAEQLLLELLAEQRDVLGIENRDTQRTMGSLANLYQQTDRYDECEAINRELLAIRRATLGDRDPATLRVLSNLANVIANQGRLAEARGYMVEVYDMKVAILGPDHVHTLNSLNNLGEVNEMLGDWDAAESWHRRAFEARRRVLGEDHPRALGSSTRLAFVLVRLDRLDEAGVLVRRSVERHRVVRGPDHPETHEAEMVMGLVLAGQGRHREAEVQLRRLLDALPPDDAETRAQVNCYLAASLAAQDRRGEAAEAWRTAVPSLWPGEEETFVIAREAIAALDVWHATDPGGGYDAAAAELRAFADAR